jgi:hypothetical protein
MTSKTLNLSIRLGGRLGWCLRINGTPYACGTQAYCIRVAETVRSDFTRHGWAAFPDYAGKKGGAA